jgi:glycosyltransferase involved in cell wall biosynthesis
VDSLAAALRAALAEPEQMMRMGLKGQQLTQAQYSANAYFELLLESYQNVYANVTRSISR